MEEGKNIPDLGIDAKGRVIEQTKKIPILINGEERSITIKKINTGTRNKIRGECTKTSMVGGKPQVKVDETELQEKVLSKAIIEAPFDYTIAGIKNLPTDVTDYIFNEYTEWAEPNIKKNLESENQSKDIT